MSFGRREFLAGVAVSATWPLAARTQQQALPVVGFLSVQSLDNASNRVIAFRRGLQEAGFVEGQNVVIEYRSANGQSERLSALVIDLVSRRVNVIFANANVAVEVAKPASTTIPIVFSIGADPVAAGLVASLNRPGGNITGVSFLSTAVMGKMLQMMHETVPGAGVIGALVNPTNPQAAIDIREAQEAARILGIELLVLTANSDREIEIAFNSLVERRAGALLVEGDGFFADRRFQIVELTARHAIPAIHRGRENAQAGGLIAFGGSITEADHQAGIYTARILRGERPADLPVQLATRVELILNLRTAKTLGITFPTGLLVRADEVIE